MSFMYDPIPYDEESAKNKVSKKENLTLTQGLDKISNVILSTWKEGEVYALDGYIAADFDAVVETLRQMDNSILWISTKECVKDIDEIDKMIAPCLPHDEKKDPYDLFGKLYSDDIETFFDKAKVSNLKERINGCSKVGIYGMGSSCEVFKGFVDKVIYIDLTPKDAVIRAQDGKYETIGDRKKGSFKDLMRRYYYVDIEVAMRQRKKLIQNDEIDWYVLETWKDQWIMLSKETRNYVFEELVKQPFRAKPIYLDGVWGGHYIRRIRNVPEKIAPRIAWSFELIPLEASILVEYGEDLLDIPFYTFLNAKETSIMGQSLTERFDGNFPVRFNYDDTWHSSGNMSIQVHPNKEYAMQNYNEANSQDEAYYVVVAGQDARTYCGFQEDGEHFIERCSHAFDDRVLLDYRKYVHSECSKPGLQVMIPSGTVHGSGRNQVVLELGSYTVGAYTYKMYDYNRKDINGDFRPIHLENAKCVLDTKRDETWIHKYSAIEPIVYEENEKYSEYVVGRNPFMYYETHQVKIEVLQEYEGHNEDEFTVFTLTEGEEVFMYDMDDPKRCYKAGYLDVIVIPASIKHYAIKVPGNQPVVLHKTIVKKKGE
jgi:hypothetical protein